MKFRIIERIKNRFWPEPELPDPNRDYDLEQINDLVNEFNEIEAGQHDRLVQLYKMLGNRMGAKRVEFGKGYAWSSNAWNVPEVRMGISMFVGSRKITSVSPGTWIRSAEQLTEE